MSWPCLNVTIRKYLCDPESLFTAYWYFITPRALRPSRRGRPISIPTLILILWTPWSLYSHSTRIWYNLSHHLSWKRKEGSIWKPRNNLCYNSSWVTRICGMGSSHIYSRNRRWHTSILYVSNNNYSNYTNMYPFFKTVVGVSQAIVFYALSKSWFLLWQSSMYSAAFLKHFTFASVTPD